MSMQEDLQFLLREGWRLVDVNTVQSPDGEITTENINKAARVWRSKKRAQQLIQEREERLRAEAEKKKKSTWNKLRSFFV